MRIKHYFGIIVVFLSFTILPNMSTAADVKYPQGDVTIVSASISGQPDQISRFIGSVIEKYWGPYRLIVLAKQGGGGLISGDFVAKSKPDGYTVGLFLSTQCNTEVYSHFRPPTYTSADLVPIMRLAIFPGGLVSRSDAPWHNLGELVAYIKSNPKKVLWAHQGSGHPYHLLGVELAKKNNADMIAVPFKSSAECNLAVLGKKVDFAISSVNSAKQFVDAGTMQMLAVQHVQRLAYMPNIPTFAELGYEVDLPPHYGSLFAAKGTPDSVVRIIHDAFKKAIEDPIIVSAMKNASIDVYYGSADDVRRDMETDRRVFGELFRSLGLIPVK